MEYTKGEWTVYWEHPDDKEDSDLRIKLNKDLSGMEDIAIILSPDNCSTKECEANAHLIALSPRMMEFIQESAKAGYLPAKRFIQSLDLS